MKNILNTMDKRSGYHIINTLAQDLWFSNDDPGIIPTIDLNYHPI